MLVFLSTLLLSGCLRPPPPTPAAKVLPTQRGGAELVVSGPVEQRVSRQPADLVIFYGGEQRGSMGDCGCPKRPRGALSRVHGYIEASRRAPSASPDLVVLGGYWLEDTMGLDGEARPDVPVMNRWMLQGVEALGVDVANVSYQDLPGLLASGPIPEWAISANIEADPGLPALPDWRVVETGGLQVGVVGMTTSGLTFQPSPGYRVVDPYAPTLRALRELAPQVDVLVLLSYGASDLATQLARAVPELDVVIDTNMHRGLFEPVAIGGTTLVRSHYQTMRLGELRLQVDEQVRPLIDRKIDMDEEIPASLEVAELARRAEEDILSVWD